MSNAEKKDSHHDWSGYSFETRAIHEAQDPEKWSHILR